MSCWGTMLLPTSGVLDLHSHAGLLVSSLGLEAVGFVFLLCKRQKKPSEDRVRLLKRSETQERSRGIFLNTQKRSRRRRFNQAEPHVSLKRRRLHSGRGEGEQRNRDTRQEEEKPHCLSLSLLWASTGSGNTMSWTRITQMLLKKQQWQQRRQQRQW